MNQPQGTYPFFARFLEEQQTLAVKTNVKAGPGGGGGGGGGGPPLVTLKYPSDDADEVLVEYP
ncbi:MAG: microviridin/marinostatin family tricyclic proteinase inhibitor [Phycisphaerales bacterium]|nr:microviridin/marinostatin family tricyclic proteinase inhibitor [Phycisphaerales bacterium]MCI0629316.1 microviridin/marinostatin family tricyclic proteinase inhibitor [Phycisphaerales bacterium]MCI0675549.1 microviridin/marinostatin family tricyclic proteinase inhibitor [Phycisphaerales bacterium]